MTFRGVTLQATRLKDVGKKLGPAKIRFNGLDASGATHAMCYIGTDGTFLGLAANDEMAMPFVGELVLSHQVEPLGWDEHDETRDSYMASAKLPTCSRASWLSRAIEIGGIHLGSSEQEIRRLLGSPETRAGNAPFTYRSTVPYEKSMPSGEKSFRHRTVEVVFTAGKVDSLTVSEVITD